MAHLKYCSIFEHREIEILQHLLGFFEHREIEIVDCFHDRSLLFKKKMKGQRSHYRNITISASLLTGAFFCLKILLVK